MTDRLPQHGSNRQASGGEPAPGLCGICAHAKVIQSGKGSRFYLCKVSSVDPRFPKYPRLPVLECAGFAKSVAVIE